MDRLLILKYWPILYRCLICAYTDVALSFLSHEIPGKTLAETCHKLAILGLL